MQRYLFGQYTLEVLDNDLIQFPRTWTKYASDIPMPVAGTIVITETRLNGCLSEAPRWICDASAHKTTLAYCENGSTQFVIERGDEQQGIFIFVESLRNRRWLLGLQYATMVALAETCIGLHGVTVVVGNQVVILSAPSGTGKSTLAKLLEKHCEAAIVNGDFALLSCEGKNGIVFEPTPFCGTSGICHNYRLKIDRIVILEQAKGNLWKTLDARASVVKLMSNVFFPDDLHIRSQIQNNILKVVESIPINLFAFEPTQEAVETFLENVN